MLISDLKIVCKNCDGSGVQLGFDEYGSIQTNFKKNCHYCSGKGYNLTELGKNVWELYLPMIQELVREELI